MTILERHVQDVKNEKVYWEWEKKWAAIESSLGGFPTKRYHQLISGRDKFGTIIWEREWDSLAVLDAAYDKMMKDPEGQSLAGQPDIVSSEHFEVYNVISAG